MLVATDILWIAFASKTKVVIIDWMLASASKKECVALAPSGYKLLPVSSQSSELLHWHPPGINSCQCPVKQGGLVMDFQPCVYILANKRNGTLYVGVTSNLPKRI
jgi:hypothetical protein